MRLAIVNFFSGKFGASGPRGFYLQAQTLTDLGGCLVDAQMMLGEGRDSYTDFSVERTDSRWRIASCGGATRR